METTGQAKKSAEGEVEEKDGWDEQGEDFAERLTRSRVSCLEWVLNDPAACAILGGFGTQYRADFGV